MFKNKNKQQKKYITIATAVAVVIIVACVVLTIVQRNKYSEFVDNEPLNENFGFLVDEPSELLVNNSLQKEMYEKYQKYLKEFDNGDYTLENPYIIVDPFSMSPQTALVMFTTSKKTSVKATIKGKHDDDFTVEFESSKKHILPIYGLYGGTENKVVLETGKGDKKEITIKVDIYAKTVDGEVIENNIKNSNGQFYFATSSLGLPSVAYDNYGEVRWYFSYPYTKGLTMLNNGHILISNSAPGPDITSTSGVIEMDMLGYIYHEYELEGGYHHDGTQLKNDNLIMLTSKDGSENVADHIVEVDFKSGKIVKEWNLREIALKIDPELIGEHEITWGWINGIDFDYETDSLLLSARNQNSIVSLDYKTGNINWILGDIKYWSPKFEKYMIKGQGTDFLYPMGEHSVKALGNGKISIFNNGYDAYKEDTKTCNSLKNNESYAMIYNVDYKNKVATVDWKFGGQEYFSYALSSLTYTHDNHKLFNSGWHIKEEGYANPDCTQFNNTSYDAYYIEFDENNNILVKLRIDESKFEAIKAPIYNLELEARNSKKVSVVPNYEVSLGTFTSTSEFDTFDILSEEDALQFQFNISTFLGCDYFNDRITVATMVDFVDSMELVFISPSGAAYRNFLKRPGETGKNSILLVNLPKGRYYVYARVDGEIFNTKQYILIK